MYGERRDTVGGLRAEVRSLALQVETVVTEARGGGGVAALSAGRRPRSPAARTGQCRSRRFCPSGPSLTSDLPRCGQCALQLLHFFILEAICEFKQEVTR